MNALERSVLRTLHYFDLFSYPLTGFEAWKWLMQKTATSPADVVEALRALQKNGHVGAQEGFYFLVGREGLVSERKEKYRLAEKKFSRVIGVARWFRFFPYVRGLAVCNSLAYANARKTSDLDIVILGVPGHLWTARFFTAGFLAMFGLRPTPKRSQDTLCLSFFLAKDDLDLSSLLLLGSDPYFAYWLEMLVPIFGDPKRFDRLRAANLWATKQLPNALGAYGSDRRRIASSGFSQTIQRVFEMIVSWMEPLLQRMQSRLMPVELSSIVNVDTRVVVNESLLKFHANDRRQMFVDRFAVRCREVGL